MFSHSDCLGKNLAGYILLALTTLAPYSGTGKYNDETNDLDYLGDKFWQMNIKYSVNLRENFGDWPSIYHFFHYTIVGAIIFHPLKHKLTHLNITVKYSIKGSRIVCTAQISKPHQSNCWFMATTI